MGKKKRFIDKKKAVSFRLVHRSQRDPLQADEDSSKHVLLPINSDGSILNQGTDKSVGACRRREQEECGVFFDDDYDYLQHLKQRTPANLEPLPENVTVIEAKKPEKKKIGNFILPGEAFASCYEEDEGLLNLAAPISGPRPDWDPDIVAALDDAIDLDDPDNILDDDFIMIADGEIDIESENNRKADLEWSYGIADDKDYYPSDDDDSWHFGDDDSDADDTGMSHYSMTSSVIRRTEGLCLLDDRFDKIMEEYDDDEIGALDDEEVSGNRNLNDPILESITNELLEAQNKLEQDTASGKAKVTFDIPECRRQSSNNDEDDDGFIKIVETPKEQWDCESILSTHSNLYNHPTLIKEQSKNSTSKTIALSKREGIPLGVLSDGKKPTIEKRDEYEVDDQPGASHVRCRGETRDEKKLRKQAVKQDRQARRTEKKTNKLLFKEERKRQEKTISNSALLVGQKIQ